MTNALPHLPRAVSRPRAFTLAELLVVLVIILILVSILVPVISKVKTAGYTADTEQELSQLSTAINEYYGIFHSYPGPFSNDQIEQEATGTNTGIPQGIANFESYNPNNTPAYGTPSTSPWTVTGTENLVLGLLGGLRIDPALNANGGNNPAFAPAEVGLGPLSLNPANPRRYSPFIDPKYILWCSNLNGQISQTLTMPTNPIPFHDLGDTPDTARNDTPIPEFVDRFPHPMPILYLRARTGAPGVVSDGIITEPSDVNSNVTAAYQYDLRDLYGYLGYGSSPGTATNLGLPQGSFHNLAGLGTVPTSWPPPQAPKAGVSSTASNVNTDAFNYFANFGYTPTNYSTTGDTNYYARPRSVDSFILIAAGPDGIYGTQDDITSFGNVAQ
ncbi:MAG: prepilin-type N-terminal cleavage/methylation domain-containing protein [Tepidisphaeraceae bacterium]|jgi:prepilin-type N-terminal cleavage/methylation domain-containing protein